MKTEEVLDISEIDRVIDAVGHRKSCLIAILQAIQERWHYLPEAALRRIPERTDISAADVAGVASFYAQFRHRPAGRHTVKVCIGTACHVKGAEGVFEAFRRYLGISGDDDTDADYLFTVEKVACLGCCMLAPAVQIDDVTYGFVGTNNVSNVLEDFIRSQELVGAEAVENESGRVSGELRICQCSSCGAAGSNEIYAQLQLLIRELRLPCRVVNVGCSGVSYQAPMLDIVLKNGHSFRYGRLRVDDLRRILLRHFRPSALSARIRAGFLGILEHLYTEEANEPVTRYCVDVRDGGDACYMRRQVPLAMEGGGALDPLDIAAYRENGGFAALESSLSADDRTSLIDRIEASGLRGRGGGGFPTAEKWRTVCDAPGELAHYLICNADEGDPGAFMDRMILESFPLRVLEGILLAAWAIGASKGYIYVRAEYPLAVRRLTAAIDICREAGLLGDRICGSHFSFELELVQGAGAFVCGEETALIAAVEGRRGMPRYRPPYPAESGLYGCPTLVNNVETFALVPWILRHGACEFRKFGTSWSSGTKSFALAGKVVRGGLIEVPMGITLREIVEDIGGGCADGHEFKAVQIGGPSGACLPASLADTAVDYDALTDVGAMMGSGGIVVLDDSDCMVDIALYFLRFTQMESCGKCTPCRIGTRRMLEILERLCLGEGRSGDIERLEELAEQVKNGSLCGLGKTAPNPVLSTLHYFRDDYEAHLAGYCPAGKCKELIRYFINDDCIGCTRCARSCGDNAIEALPYRRHEIDDSKCTRCDSCRQVCPVKAVEIVRR